MIIVSDTSPITNLIQVNQLELLHILFGTILVPQSVYDELCQIPAQKMLIDNQRWIWVQAASNRTLITMLEQDLDEGEAEAIALTLEVYANYLIIDEAKGRAIAEKMGIKIIGLLGTLVKAKQQGLLLEIKPIMEHLATLGFRIRPSLFNQILKIVGESTK